MKFLVLGATGRTGVLFVKKALDQGHHVTALVRRADAAVDSRAQIVSGDVTDAAVIATAARGHDAIVSTLREAVTRSAGLAAKDLKGEKKSGLRVHARTGQPCPECGDTIREVSFADSAFQYCPTCQTGGKPLADRRLSRLLKLSGPGSHRNPE